MEAFEALEADRFFLGVRGDDAGDAMCAGEEPLGDLAPCEWGVDGGFPPSVMISFRRTDKGCVSSVCAGRICIRRVYVLRELLN